MCEANVLIFICFACFAVDHILENSALFRALLTLAAVKRAVVLLGIIRRTRFGT